MAEFFLKISDGESAIVTKWYKNIGDEYLFYCPIPTIEIKYTRTLNDLDVYYEGDGDGRDFEGYLLYKAKDIALSNFFSRISNRKGRVFATSATARKFSIIIWNMVLKGTAYIPLTDFKVKQVEQKLNDRPVRKFNYLTPNQVLQKKIALVT